jgi:hypothetical protein
VKGFVAEAAGAFPLPGGVLQDAQEHHQLGAGLTATAAAAYERSAAIWTDREENRMLQR